RGTYVIMGDADDSYDFTALDPFLERLRAGDDLVMGNRFAGGIEKGAMPPLHRYLGNPVLSFLGRLFFHTEVRDFHCGLRAFRTDSVRALGLQCPGMEFASEVVVKATLAGQRVGEVPTKLHPDGRTRPPHLRSWRDGWRHLRFLLMYSPRWLFLIPGLVMFGFGAVLTAVLAFTPVTVAGVRFDVGTMIVSSALVFLGYQSVLFALFTKTFAARAGFLPRDERIVRFERVVTLEKALVVGGVLALAGVVGVVAGFVRWAGTDFGDLDARELVRLVVPSVVAVVLGLQTAFAGLFLNILRFEPRRPG
ncbi:MAG TPA: glycosyltransferase family 2 protein, partial [Acidimicrobiales bacterium]